ncbi:RRQRL motif-containing zinc-binding protein [Streptomyces sp. NPDC005167]
MRRSRRRKAGVSVAYLYRVDMAKPVRPMTPGRAAALAKAMRARRTCPKCHTDAGYRIATSLGMAPPAPTPRISRSAEPLQQVVQHAGEERRRSELHLVPAIAEASRQPPPAGRYGPPAPRADRRLSPQP